MKKTCVVSSYLAAMIAMSSISALGQIDVIEFEYFHDPAECPSLSDLNLTTQHWHGELLQYLIEDEPINGAVSVISPEIDFETMTILNHGANSEICAMLNEKHWGLHPNNVHDLTLERMVPFFYHLYYRSAGYIVEFIAPYSAGEEGDKRIGPPTLGAASIRIYDQDLNVLVEMAF